MGIINMDNALNGDISVETGGHKWSDLLLPPSCSTTDITVTEPEDHYAASIELSNACRKFYVNRLKSAAKMKERLGLVTSSCLHCSPDDAEDLSDEANKISHKTCSLGHSKPEHSPHCYGSTLTLDKSNHLLTNSFKKGLSHSLSSSETASTPNLSSLNQTKILHKSSFSNLDKSMLVLKREMASLMDQDLALMRQLLTLNERIEEMKWQRKLGNYSRGSMNSNSIPGFSTASILSMSDVDEEDWKDLHVKYPTPSSLSLYRECGPINEEEITNDIDHTLVDNDDEDDDDDDVYESCSSTAGSKEYASSTWSPSTQSKCTLNSTLTTVTSSSTQSLAASTAIATPEFKKSSEQTSFDSGIHETETDLQDEVIAL